MRVDELLDAFGRTEGHDGDVRDDGLQYVLDLTHPYALAASIPLPRFVIVGLTDGSLKAQLDGDVIKVYKTPLQRVEGLAEP